MGRGRACLLISLLYRCEMRDSLSRFRDTVISVCVGRYCVHSTRSRALVGSSTSCVTGILISKVCCALPRDAITSQRSRAKIRRAPYVYVFECLTETLLAFEPFSHSRVVCRRFGLCARVWTKSSQYINNRQPITGSLST